MLELHPMTEEDFAAYREVALSDNRAESSTGAWANRDEAGARLDGAFPGGLATPQVTFLTIVAPPRVGFLIYQDAARDRVRECFVLDLHVLPAFRRRGYASSALARLRESASLLGFQRIGLSVLPTNDAAERLYRSVGFEPAFTRFHLTLSR